MFRKLFNVFSKHDKKLYHVGGSVRDMVLKKVPKDYDFTTDALPGETQKILENGGFKQWPLGEKFGTVAAFVDGNQIEITTHREDITSGRHPKVIFTKDLELDLKRRDLTINSMAMGENGQIFDPFNGTKDLANRVIRATGNPRDRLEEDPLRMLRAIRFIAKLGFNLDKDTQKAITHSAQRIMSVSRERWLEELNKLLVGSYAGKALESLRRTRLIGYLLPEIFPIFLKDNSASMPSKDLWHHTRVVVSKANPTPIVRWAALLHDIAKPQTRQETYDGVHFFQHEVLGAELVDSIGRRLKMPNAMRVSIRGLVLLHQRVGDIVSRKNDPPVSKSALRRLAKDCEQEQCEIADLIELFAADSSSRRKEVQERQRAHAKLLREALTNMKEEDLRPKLPKGIGQAIMDRFGLSPGPKVGEIKGILDQLLMDGKIDSDTSIDDMIQILEDLDEIKET